MRNLVRRLVREKPVVPFGSHVDSGAPPKVLNEEFVLVSHVADEVFRQPAEVDFLSGDDLVARSLGDDRAIFRPDVARRVLSPNTEFIGLVANQIEHRNATGADGKVDEVVAGPPANLIGDPGGVGRILGDAHRRDRSWNRRCFGRDLRFCRRNGVLLHDDTRHRTDVSRAIDGPHKEFVHAGRRAAVVLPLAEAEQQSVRLRCRRPRGWISLRFARGGTSRDPIARNLADLVVGERGVVLRLVGRCEQQRKRVGVHNGFCAVDRGRRWVPLVVNHLQRNLRACISGSVDGAKADEKRLLRAVNGGRNRGHIGQCEVERGRACRRRNQLGVVVLSRRDQDFVAEEILIRRLFAQRQRHVTAAGEPEVGGHNRHRGGRGVEGNRGTGGSVGFVGGRVTKANANFLTRARSRQAIAAREKRQRGHRVRQPVRCRCASRAEVAGGQLHLGGIGGVETEGHREGGRERSPLVDRDRGWPRNRRGRIDGDAV